ncbi:MAG: shikimate dehydrogenase [Salinarimonas sp.]
MTRKAFVVGHPIAHSRSPLIHNHWIAHYGLSGRYEARDVAPDDFAGFLEGFRDEGFVGGNVTIPHKEAAFAGVVHASERARRLGAVNTLWLDNGALCGDNTDITGYLANLDAACEPGWEGQAGSALVLGAGGAARAVVAGLIERDLSPIRLVNRTRERAEALAGLFAGYDKSVSITVHGFDELPTLVPQVGLIVNTTSLGMAGQPPLPLDLGPSRDDAIVSDIVYVPLETPLLAIARARGLACVDGLGMLLHQAVPGFERWFGIRPEVTPALRELIERDLFAGKGSRE